jgi:ABC-type Mn2+/Zn2+ transport system permease subunit
VYDLLIQPFADNEFLRNALLGGALAALICAVVGTFVVLRGLAFIADALAHGVLPGLAGAVLLGFPPVLGAAAGTVVMMAGVQVLTRRSRLGADTAIGLFFAGMLALGVMMTSRTTSFTGDLTRILFGELLGVDRTEIAWQLVALVMVALLAWLCRRPFLLLCVDPDIAATSGFRVRLFESVLLGMVAVAVISSFQSVGSLLVFGLLVAPAATGALFARRISTVMAVAAVIGTLSVYAGLLLSYHADLAAGASVVVVAVAVFLVAFAVMEVRRYRHRPEPAPPHAHAHAHGGDVGHVERVRP